MPSRWSVTAACLAITSASAVASAQSLHPAREFFALPDNAQTLLAAPPAGPDVAASRSPAAARRAFSDVPAARGSQQPSTNHQRAVQAFERGVSYADQLQWADAADAFQEAYRLEPLPSTLRNLGLAHRALGHYTQAIDELQRFLSEANPQPEIRSQVQQIIEQMRGELATVVIAPTPSNASVTLDDHPVHANEEIQADPGNHVVAATASGYARTAQTITVQRGENRRVQLQLESEGGGIFSQWWLWTIVGAVVVGGVAVSIVLLSHEEPPNCGTLNVCVSPH